MLDPPPKTIGLLLECLFTKLIISSSFLAILKSLIEFIFIDLDNGVINPKDLLPCNEFFLKFVFYYIIGHM